MVEEKNLHLKNNSGVSAQENELTNLPDIFKIAFSQQQRLLGGVNVQTILYPRYDKRGRSIVDIVCFAGKETYRKSFVSNKEMRGSTTCKLQNKSGVFFDIPLQLIEKIYRFISRFEIKIEDKESIKPLFEKCVTIGEFVKQYFIDLPLMKSYSNKIILNKLLEYWENVKITEVYSDNIEKYIERSFVEGKAGGTIKKRCIILKKIFNLMGERNYIQRNPFKTVKIPDDMPIEKTSPIPSEIITDIFEKLKNSDKTLYQYCALIYYTGIRPSDIWRLKADILNGLMDFDVFILKKIKIKTEKSV